MTGPGRVEIWCWIIAVLAFHAWAVLLYADATFAQCFAAFAVFVHWLTFGAVSALNRKDMQK